MRYEGGWGHSAAMRDAHGASAAHAALEEGKDRAEFYAAVRHAVLVLVVLVLCLPLAGRLLRPALRHAMGPGIRLKASHSPHQSVSDLLSAISAGDGTEDAAKFQQSFDVASSADGTSPNSPSSSPTVKQKPSWIPSWLRRRQTHNSITFVEPPVVPPPIRIGPRNNSGSSSQFSSELRALLQRRSSWLPKGPPWTWSITSKLDDPMFSSLRPSLPYVLLLLVVAICLAACPLILIGIALASHADDLYIDLMQAVRVMAQACLILVLPFAYLYAEAGSPGEHDLNAASTAAMVGAAYLRSETPTSDSDGSPEPSWGVQRRASSFRLTDTLLPASYPASASQELPSVGLLTGAAPVRPRRQITTRLLETFLTLALVYGLLLMLLAVYPRPTLEYTIHCTALGVTVLYLAPKGLALILESLSHWLVLPSEAKRMDDLLQVVHMHLLAIESESELGRQMRIKARLSAAGRRGSIGKVVTIGNPSSAAQGPFARLEYLRRNFSFRNASIFRRRQSSSASSSKLTIDQGTSRQACGSVYSDAGSPMTTPFGSETTLDESDSVSPGARLLSTPMSMSALSSPGPSEWTAGSPTPSPMVGKVRRASPERAPSPMDDYGADPHRRSISTPGSARSAPHSPTKDSDGKLARSDEERLPLRSPLQRKDRSRHMEARRAQLEQQAAALSALRIARRPWVSNLVFLGLVLVFVVDTACVVIAPIIPAQSWIGSIVRVVGSAQLIFLVAVALMAHARAPATLDSMLFQLSLLLILLSCLPSLLDTLVLHNSLVWGQKRGKAGGISLKTSVPLTSDALPWSVQWWEWTPFDALSDYLPSVLATLPVGDMLASLVLWARCATTGYDTLLRVWRVRWYPAGTPQSPLSRQATHSTTGIS